MLFVSFETSTHRDVRHLARALVSEAERRFLRDYATTVMAINDQACISPDYDRVLTATRDTWRVISEELDVVAKTWKGDPQPQTPVHTSARGWCEAIRVRVLGEPSRYFGYQ